MRARYPDGDEPRAETAQDELDRLAEEFVSRSRKGESPSISEYAHRHPEHADEIRDIFPLLTAMEGIKAAEPMAGTHVGPYEIVREIGRGGMGVVYEAEQKELDRRVALKILPTQATLDPRFLERFRLEAQAAAKLNHPNIVPVIGYGQADDISLLLDAVHRGTRTGRAHRRRRRVGGRNRRWHRTRVLRSRRAHRAAGGGGARACARAGRAASRRQADQRHARRERPLLDHRFRAVPPGGLGRAHAHG